MSRRRPHTFRADAECAVRASQASRALLAAGAAHVAFNGATKAELTRLLTRVLAAEA